MQGNEKVQFFLEDGLRTSALAGSHNFLRLVSEVLQEAGLDPEYLPMTARDTGSGRTLIHMKSPASRDGLVFRRVYHYPFWQIDQTDQRWAWDVAKAAFDPDEVPDKDARRFQRFWRNRLFPDVTVTDGDAIYVPLQGKLTLHRSFQRCAPLDMVKAVATHTDRPVVVTLHPKETYSSSERDALDKLVRTFPNLSCHVGGMETHLPACHMVVTQNSSAAFNGYFFDKPAILFADIDFHHAAQWGELARMQQLLNTAAPRVDYAKYLWWFWQDQSINAGRPDAKDKIRARLTRFGWPVG